MTVIPARLAGVEEIVVATPPKAFATSLPLRFTLARLDVREIWGMGGAQAVAALAYGTETIRRVDKIVGPGNAWVTAAKQIVAGDVGIDGLPGPTEIVVFADATADPALVAADLLAQAEHDVLAAAILVTADRKLAKSVADAGRSAARSRSRPRPIARESIDRYGAALVVDDLEQGLDLVEAIAPEHLQLMGDGPESLAHRVSRAGAVVVGRASTAVFGDYVAGPSHVLPDRRQRALVVGARRRRLHPPQPRHPLHAGGGAGVGGDGGDAGRRRGSARARGGGAAEVAMKTEAVRAAGTPARFVRPELRELHPYTLEQTACRFKLDQNEVPWDFPARLKREALARLAAVDWARYPDFHADELRRALAERLDWPMEGHPGRQRLERDAGHHARRRWCGRAPRCSACCPRSGSTRCSCAAPVGGRASCRRAPTCACRSRSSRPRSRATPSRPLLLCSPNNPTGAAATVEEIERLLEALDAPLLLDNAYGEFCRFDYRPLLDRHSNLLLFRTFSKAWSLGGMRLGYLVAHPDLVAELIKVKLPYNLNHAGVAAGLAALGGSDAAARRIRRADRPPRRLVRDALRARPRRASVGGQLPAGERAAGRARRRDARRRRAGDCATRWRAPGSWCAT